MLFGKFSEQIFLIKGNYSQQTPHSIFSFPNMIIFPWKGIIQDFDTGRGWYQPLHSTFSFENSQSKFLREENYSQQTPNSSFNLFPNMIIFPKKGDNPGFWHWKEDATSKANHQWMKNSILLYKESLLVVHPFKFASAGSFLELT